MCLLSVQVRTGPWLVLAELDSFLRSEIEGHKAPRSFWLVGEVKYLPNGKLYYCWAM